MTAERLYNEIRNCTRCALSRTRGLAVPGEGPLDSDLMFIGEAPGANEDRQGRPFVGAAGQFLEELLAAAGLRRNEVYICNVLKCRPPGNRDPQPAEIDACQDYLDRQIDLIQPLVIVTLGRYSMARFFPQQTISRIHGRARQVAGRYYVPMYHPAAALHQQNLRPTMIEDFQNLGATLAAARNAARTVEPDNRALSQPQAPAPAEQPNAPAAADKPEQIRLFD